MGGMVLVVDDEPDVADVHARQLRPRHDVRLAHSGEAALDSIDGEIDVVLLDRRLGDYSGDEVLETIREREYDCRVVMVTAVTPDVDIVEMPFDDYVVKPVTGDDLHDVVDRMLTRAAYHDHAREYFQLVAKRAALKAHRPRGELDTSEEFERLESKIEETRARLDAAMTEFEDHDFKDLFEEFARNGER